MSTRAGTIAAPVSHRPVWFSWVVALALAGMLAAFGAWAVFGQEVAPAPEVKNPPVVTERGPTGEGSKGAEFRTGPNGEAYPAPRVGQ